MRGHPHCLSRSPHISSISHSCRLCLLNRLAPRPAPRAVGRGVMPPFVPCVPLLVPSVVRLVSRPASPARSLPLAYFPSVPLSPWLSRIASRSVPLLPAHRPAARVEERGDTIVLLVVMLVVSACLTWCRSYLKTLLGNLLKICLGKLLKTFTGNLLKTIRYIPLSYMSAARLSAVVSLCVAACRLAVLSRLCFELIETAHFCDSVSPRSPSRHASCVMRHARRPPVFSSVGAYHSSSFTRLVPASRQSCRHSLTSRLTDTHGGERNGTGTVAWRVRVI